jgi:hypothetical protein
MESLGTVSFWLFIACLTCVGLVLVFVEIEIYWRGVVKNEVVLAVRSRRDVDVCSRVVYMHYVVNYVCLGAIRGITTLRLFLVGIIVVCIVGIHVNLAAVRRIELLSCVEVLNIRSRAQVNSRLTPVLVAVDDESLNLLGEHRQPFVFRSSAVGEVDMLRVYNHSRSCYCMV